MPACDPTKVYGPNTKPASHVLHPSSASVGFEGAGTVTVGGGPAGATCLSVPIDDACEPTAGWTTRAPNDAVTLAAGQRVAFRFVGDVLSLGFT